MNIVGKFFTLLALLIVLGVGNVLNGTSIALLSTWFFVGTIICIKELNGSVFRSGFVPFVLIIVGPLAYPTIKEMKKRSEW